MQDESIVLLKGSLPLLFCLFYCILVTNMASPTLPAITSATMLSFLVVGSGMSCVGAFQPSIRQLSSHAVAPTTIANAPATASSTSLDMFTGIIEEMGNVVSLEQRDDMTLWDGTKGSGTELVVKGGVVMDGAYLG